MSSFKKINYSLRPAKSVERRMLSFALKKLNHLCHLSEYQYVGFGATTFQDFILFHKDLGINKMISIESSRNKERFDFNKPFHCIDMIFGESQSVLPSLQWSTKTILWLDYDKPFQKSYLKDVETFFSSATSGSIFLLTINCESFVYGNDNEERKQTLIDSIGEANLHFGNKLIDFSTANLPNSISKIIKNKINSTLADRNGVLNKDEKLSYEQLFYFHYADGVKMLTIGGLILNSNDKEIADSANFEEYDFIRKNEDFFNIDIPILTTKEIRFLNSQLPNGIDMNGDYLDEVLSNPKIPATDIVKYKKIYNFFPTYTEVFSI